LPTTEIQIHPPELKIKEDKKMTIQSYLSKPYAWFSSWLTMLLLATITTACGGGGGGGDQGREPILGLSAASIVALNISPLTSSVQIGGLQQYVATASYADGSSRIVSAESTWTSSVAANAKVSTLGAAQGIAAGSTVITAQYMDKTASANLAVLPATLTSMALTPLNPSIPKGSQQIFKAIGTYSDGSSKDISTISNFTASNTTIANIAVNGIATALLVGTTPIIASSGGLSATTNLTVTPATLVQIAISPNNPTLPIGTTQALTVTASYSDGSTIDVSNSSVFTAGTPAVAKVTANSGIVTAIATGTSVMTAVFDGMTVNTTVTVAPAQLVSIVVTPKSANVFVAGTQSFVATGTYTDGSTANISNTVVWTSSDVTKATILPTGLATGLAVGSSVMTATLNAKSGSGTLIVSMPILVIPIDVAPNTSGNPIVSHVKIFLNSIDVTPNTASILVSGTQTFIATALYSNDTIVDISNLATWTSSDTTIATVLPNGVATGFNVGTTSIVANYQNKSDSSLLTVSAGPSLVSISVSPSPAVIVQGTNINFSATGTYSDNTTANITNLVSWSSSLVTLATVNSNGVANGVSPGTTVITALLKGKSGTANLTVAAPLLLVSIAPSPINASAAIGAKQQFTATGTYNNLSTANISNDVVWSSSNAVIATVSNSAPKGLASALSAGVTTISATQGSISGNTNFTVTAAPIVSINLGVADSFAVLAGTSITNNAGGLTLVTGDVGSPSQTVDPVQVGGYTNYKSGAILTNALADLQVAISDANARTCTVTSAAGIDLGGLTLTPGIYCYAGAINITGTFTMNGPGLYIFRTTSTLDSAANSAVALNAGASAGTVFWVPSGASTLGANSVFKGTIMANAAAITMGDTATLQNGRVLSASAVTLKNNVISR
jgi:hypothetical protein